MLESILLSKHQPKDSRAVFHPLTVAKLTDPHETERNLPLFCHRMLSTSSASAPDWAQAKGMMEVSITSLSLVVFVRVTESYSGENVGHRPGERAAVLPRATIDITEIAIRFQNEITLAATITPRPRAMRDDRRPPTLRNCTELSTAPRVSARAFPVDANLRDLARLHAGHGAMLRFNQSLGYGKLLKVDFHDSACDSHFGANEEVDGPVRRDRYLD